MNGERSPDLIGVARDALRAYHTESADFTNRYGPAAADPSPFLAEVSAFAEWAKDSALGSGKR